MKNEKPKITNNVGSNRSISNFIPEGGEHDDGVTTYRPDKPELEENFRNFGNDSAKVPSHIKEYQDETLQDWGRKLNKIVITKAIEFIYQKIMKRNIIVIVGPTGSGKSATAYYAAFKLRKNNGHTIIPVRQPDDITNYHMPGTKQIFIIDDFIGKYAVNETDVYLWEKHVPLLKIIFCKNDDTKLILTSRTYIWQPERYACLSLDAYMCDLLSDHVSLTLTERRDICQSYLNHDDIKALKDETLFMYSFIPSICSSYISSENIPVERFFAVPYIMIEKEIDNFKIKSQVSFIALAILAIKQTISTNSFAIDNHEFDTLFHDVFHESAFLQYPSKNLLKSSLVALIGTYVKRTLIISYLNIQDENGYTPLHLASNSAIAKALLDYNANINPVDAFGRSPVYLACCTNQVKVLAVLIEKNADINQKTKTGLRPLHAACQSGSIGIVNMLIEQGAKINRSEPGITPLHEACKHGNECMIHTLIAANASVNHKTNYGLTPLHEACRNDRISAVKYFWIIKPICARGCRAIVDVLLQRDAHVNICDDDKVTPLILACKEEYTDVVDSLLRSKANVNYCEKDNCSSLLIACKTGNVDLVHLLLKYSADINLADIDMITPLHAACMNNNNTKLVLKLVESNANVNAADKNGQTPLFKSICNGNTDIVDSLLRHGALIDIYDTSGLSP
ncbi:ANK [Mytilus edulis]|uniref:ANK n=1 Tax=Mytilus edulis TaxID=6550 RepID=A0A8S3U8B7_MYTED|nr:ANK [Mytilus edulis]